jgi:serine/threonine protein kinase
MLNYQEKIIMIGENIVKLIDVLITKNNVYIIQEYCNGGDLRNLMTKKKVQKHLINLRE